MIRRGLTYGLCHLGECKPIIAEYLRCLRRVKGMNDAECRMMAKDYLKCRLDQYVIFYILYPYHVPSSALAWSYSSAKEEEWSLALGLGVENDNTNNF